MENRIYEDFNGRGITYVLRDIAVLSYLVFANAANSLRICINAWLLITHHTDMKISKIQVAC